MKEPSKFTIYKGKKYKLIGKCLKCGKCCLGKVAYYQEYEDKKKEETCRVVSVKLENPSFKNEGCISILKNNLCNIYEKRPPLCSDYPRIYQELELFTDCGYKWKFVCNTKELDTKLVLYEDDRKYKGETENAVRQRNKKKIRWT